MPMLHVRLTDAEMEALKAGAGAVGSSLSAHVRALLVSPDATAPFVHPRLGVAALRESEPLPPEPAKPPRERSTLGVSPLPQTVEAISAAERAHRTHAILERAAHSKPRPPRR